MKILFENLGGINFDIGKTFAMNQRWANNSSFSMNSPRPTDALLFFSGSSAELVMRGSGTKTKIESGSLCLIPHGNMYTWTFHNNADSDGISSMLFEFILTDADGIQIELEDSLKVIDSVHSGLYRQMFSELINEFSRPQISYPRIKASGFSLIASASEAMRKKSVSGENFSCIYKGIKYLEKDPVQEKSVAEIAEMCGVSVNYFERLFKEYSGTTPALYRMLRKIDRAKSMLEIPSLSVEQIAAELNYSDCAYFCKCFKKLTGMTANEYRTMRAK